MDTTRLLTLTGFGWLRQDADGDQDGANSCGAILQRSLVRGYVADKRSRRRCQWSSDVSSAFATKPANNPRHRLVVELASKETILVLDNCEHVLEACSQLSDALLDECPNVRLIATSRQALNVPGERVVPLRPLSVEAEGSS
jgi:predicted ATPase